MHNYNINTGDKVRHKTKFLNGNVPMTVSKISDNHVLCEHFEYLKDDSSINKQTWFHIDEVHKIFYEKDNP